jgi:DNA polymerase-3 subunit epsilon
LSCDRRFAFVDLETTGGNAATDRITEIGIVRMADGEVVDEWSSLVNPGIPIPPEIQALTGITNAMVREAPPFAALVETVAARLDDWTFVAHSARFDYGFLKSEFRRVGRRFLADVLCTVRLSRRLDPGHARHGLDAVVARHGLPAIDRHRALGDARLIAQFYALMRRTRPADELEGAITHLLRRPALPPHVPEERLLQVPDEPGVYVFRGINGIPIYVGKARNLRERVFAHFYADSRDANDARLTAEIRDVEVEETAGEFSALVREIELIRACAPLYNVALRRREGACFIEVDDVIEAGTGGARGHAEAFGRVSEIDRVGEVGRGSEVGYVGKAIDIDRANAEDRPVRGDGLRLGWRIRPLVTLDPRHPERLHGPFGSRQGARAALAALGREHRLCDRALGLWTEDRACFSRQIGRCLGLCCGEESAADHQRRLRTALAPLAFPRWPFDGRAELIEFDPDRGRRQRLLFDHWCIVDPTTDEAAPFDIEIYKLLRRTLARRPEAFSGRRATAGPGVLAAAAIAGSAGAAPSPAVGAVPSSARSPHDLVGAAVDPLGIGMGSGDR